MAIEAEIPVTLAKVDWTDDYMVKLRQRRRKVAYMPAEARQLADELRAAADAAESAMRSEIAEHQAQEAWRTVAHAFDLAPICRECTEGKHGACDGRALVEVGGSVKDLRCGCADADHGVMDGAA
jgi:hypothetical protein